MASIHPTAIVSAGARLAPDVSIGAFSIIGSDVEIGAGTAVASHVVIGDRTRIGRRNRIFQFTSVGEIPQDRKYGGEPTRTSIGDDTSSVISLRTRIVPAPASSQRSEAQPVTTDVPADSA